jgi:prevent-host-death family protein
MNTNIADFRDNLSDLLNRVAYVGERVVLERRGKPVAALVSIDDLELLERLEDDADIRAARKALKAGGRPIPLAQIEAELRLAQRSQPRRKRSAG